MPNQQPITNAHEIQGPCAPLSLLFSQSSLEFTEDQPPVGCPMCILLFSVIHTPYTKAMGPSPQGEGPC